MSDKSMTLALSLIGASVAVAQAVEVGDVVWLSTSGVGLTVTEVVRRNRETVEMTARAMDANAAEFCERYGQLSSGNPKWEECVRENVSNPRKIIVNCRTATIILNSGSYRRGKIKGGPWPSVGNPNFIIHADSLFDMACKR
jgi:hypothetical protein